MSERVIDTQNMSIYKKLAYLQKDAQGINTSDLDELIHELQGLTFNYNTVLIFSFTTDAVLKLKDWRQTNGEISIRVPITDSNKINDYKWCLLTNLFLLTNTTITNEEENITNESNTDDDMEDLIFTTVTNDDLPKVVNLIKERLLKKDNTLQITPKMIYEQSRVLAKDNTIGLTAQKEVSDWYKNNTNEEMIL